MKRPKVPACAGGRAGRHCSFSAAQPVGCACSICSHWPKRFGPALWTRCAAGPRVGNYRALFQNTAFRLAVRNTCRFLCICILALLAVSLL